MDAPDCFYYSMLLAWLSFMINFMINWRVIQEKIGVIIWPLMFIFFGIIINVHPESVTYDDLIFFAKGIVPPVLMIIFAGWFIKKSRGN